MKKFQHRVLQEKSDLEFRHKKLQEFFATDTFYTLPEEEQDRLLRQSNIMIDYIGILAERIEAFKE